MEKIVVQKYGGTSVANPERIKSVAERVVATKKQGYKVVVVVSALGDTTDRLIELSKQITDHPSEREYDMLLATGEQVSVALLAMAIHELGHEAISFTGAQVGIITDTSFSKAKVINVNGEKIEQELAKGRIVIVAGFQGMTQDQEITTLGRGGSNLTAVALSKSLGGCMCEMNTDVEGVFTADPRIVKTAQKLDYLSYDEMLEMASLGSQVLQARSVIFAKKFDVPIHVRSSFSNKKGTIILKEAKPMWEGVVISGVTLDKKEAKMTICDVPDKPGMAAQIFKHLAEAEINVDMIIQNISRTRRTDLSFTVPQSELPRTMKIAKQIVKDVKAEKVTCDDDIAKVSIVGVGMKSHPGVAAKMFDVLAKKKINIEMISTSEISISCVIGKKHAESAVKALHTAFGLDAKKPEEK
ncbi:MAG: aspartate kinase [Candidatus Omnitrophica bacterium]|nr:aspartate kinase [Candidatus Omnitrophota bacterium]